MSPSVTGFHRGARKASARDLTTASPDEWLLGPALPAVATELIRVETIDRQDHRFQLRLTASGDDLVESLRTNGQQCPVVLWGRTKPYKIIDGFRRIDALLRLGQQTVLAIVRNDLDQTQALAVSLIENARRKNLTPLDKASAVWKTLHISRLGKRFIAKAFGLSVRQIERYLQMLDFDGSVLDGVLSKKITMAHAVLLHRAKVTNPSDWIDEIVCRKLSEKELKERLLSSGSRRSRGSHLVRDKLGFRMHAFRFRFDMNQSEKNRIRETLQMALELLEMKACQTDRSPESSCIATFASQSGSRSGKAG